MAKINLTTGAAGSYYFFRQRIIEHIASGQEDSYLYILPVNRAVRYLKKSLLIQTGKQALIDPPIFTFQTLIRHIYIHSANAKRVVSPSVRLMFLRRIVEDQHDKLRFLKHTGSTTSGLILKIDRMLAELSQFGFKPGRFSPPPESAIDKYADLQLLMTALYDSYGGELIDETMLFAEIVDGMGPDSLAGLFPGLQTIYINGYGIFTPPMIRFIENLGQRYQIDIKLEYDTTNHELFAHTYNAYDALCRLTDKPVSSGNEENALSRNLFTLDRPDQGDSSFEAKFFEHEAATRDEEVRQMAAAIRELHYSKKIPLHRIGITFPDLEKYAARIRQVFTEFEIPFNLSTGFALSQSPLIQAYLQVLKLRVSGFDSAEMGRLLATPFLFDEYRVNMTHFGDLVSRYQIKRFDENWDEFLVKQDKDLPEHLRHLMTVIKNLYTIISRLKLNLPFPEIRAEYFIVLDQLGMLKWFERAQNDLTRIEKEREFRAYNRFYKLINQLDLITGLQPPSLTEFSSALHLVIKEASYNLREWSNYGVQCMPRLEIQSLECEILFIGGLVEGEFPRAPHRDIFFNDSERQHLGLNAVEDLLAQDRFQFYQLLASPASRIIFSYPQFEEDAKLLPSSFLRSLKEIVSVAFYDDEAGPEKFLTRRKFPEHLARCLHSEISTADEERTRHWVFRNSSQHLHHLIGVIETLYHKAERTKISAFEGNLSASSAIRAVLKKSALNRTFSITALEMYAFCPIKYYLLRILGLAEEEEEKKQFSALERGALIHAILFKFYTSLKKENKHDQPWEHLTTLLTIARQEIDGLTYQGVTWELEKELILGSEEQNGLLHRFLEVENEQAIEHGFQPEYFEFAFGLSNRKEEADNLSQSDPLIVASDELTVRLSGKIDRIDIDKAGHAMIIDYKTGKSKNAGMREIYDGKSLQLPVYIAAAQHFLPDQIPVAGTYFQVRDAQNCSRTIAVVDDEQKPGMLIRGYGRLPNKSYPIHFQQLIDRSLNFVIEHVKLMVQGNFRHTEDPDSENCRSYCLMSKICRKDVAKLKAMAE